MPCAPCFLRCRLPGKGSEAGFTLTELMVTVVILGIVAAIAFPSMSQNTKDAEGRNWPHEIARELQKCKYQAVSDRVRIRAQVFNDRIELRKWRLFNTVGALVGELAAKDTAAQLTTQVPLTSDATIRRLTTAPGLGVAIWAAPALGGAPPGTQMTSASSEIIDFFTDGTVHRDGVAQPRGTTIFVRQTVTTTPAVYRDYRVDIHALTSYVQVRDGWL